jgi:hypothetical protein
MVIGRRTSDGFRRMYINGINSIPSNTGTTLPGAPIVNPTLGQRSGGGARLDGRIYWFGHWEYALTELQMRDLEARLRRQFNDI